VEAQSFGRKYAHYYDALYADKDYRGESEVIKNLLKRFAPKASTLLELGCETGSYTRILARDYSVTAIERSRYMLEIAQKKDRTRRVRYLLGDIVTRLPQISGRFDACVGLFHVVNYLNTKQELRTLLTGVHSVLGNEGLVIFDSWNGLAVLTEPPSTRVREVNIRGRTIIRTAEPRLDTMSNSCEIVYRVFVTKNNRVIDSFSESHRIRYFFPLELREILQESGFEALRITRDGKKTLTETDWSMLVVARRV